MPRSRARRVRLPRRTAAATSPRASPTASLRRSPRPSQRSPNIRSISASSWAGPWRLSCALPRVRSRSPVCGSSPCRLFHPSLISKCPVCGGALRSQRFSELSCRTCDHWISFVPCFASSSSDASRAERVGCELMRAADDENSRCALVNRFAAQFATLGEQGHAVHQVLQGHDSDQPLIINHRDDGQAARRELAECGGKRLALLRHLVHAIHEGLHVSVALTL